MFIYIEPFFFFLNLDEKFYRARISELERNSEINSSFSSIYQMGKLGSRKIKVVSIVYLII